MLKEKVAVIIGASHEIGKVIALEFASQGALVVVHYKESKDAALRVKEEIEMNGGQAQIFQCDVSDYQQCEKFVKSIIRTYGKLDILVNHEGFTRDGIITRMTEEDFDQVIRVNLKGTYNTIRFAARQMFRQRFGRIINLSSIVGLNGNAGQINYAASQAGIIGITKSAAKEFAQKGITVNAIAPGFIQTEIVEALSEKVKGMIAAQIPMHKFGLPEDIAKTAAFLASDGAAYITGQVIQVDGGMAI